MSPPTVKYILYGSARSSCAWRVRSTLEYKKIPYEYRPVSIYTGQQHSEEYKTVNPAEMIPALLVPTGDGTYKTLFESLAIIDYLDRVHPKPPVYPTDPITRTNVIAIAEMIVSSIQPLSSFKFMKVYAELNDGNQQKALDFTQHWIAMKFDKLETILGNLSGKFTVGDEFSVADMCLVPQMYNAIRYGMKLEKWPLLKKFYEQLIENEAISKAKPENMPDFGSGTTFVDTK